MKNRSAELAVTVSILLLFAILAKAAPGYFSNANLRDLFLANLPVLLIALGMTLVILTGEIDISVGSIFAVASVAMGLFTNIGIPVLAAAVLTCLFAAAMGALNGALVSYLRIPSIVVTLAAMIALRDSLRWATGGAWVTDLPTRFQWLGLSQSAYLLMMAILAFLLVGAFAISLRNTAAGRLIYATGSNLEAARLNSINTKNVKLSAFTLLGAMTGLAAALNAVRFNQIPSNAGLGLEMKVIAAVVVGGTAIRGGRGSVAGTVLGVILLGAMGPALTFLGVSAYWEKALQGSIILAAISLEVVRRVLERRLLEKKTGAEYAPG